jgi:hypothetical protein
LTVKNVSPAAFEARLADEQSGMVEDVQPRKQAHQTSEELLAELENEFLTPSDKFNTKWLNSLQKYVCLFFPFCWLAGKLRSWMLTASTDDGMSRQTIQIFSNLPPHNLEPSLASHGKD